MLSYIDSDILIVNFDNLNRSSVPEEEESSQYSKYNFRSSKGLNGGAIAAIIIVPIVALISLVGSFFFIKKRKVNSPDSDNSAIHSIQNLKIQ